jgi:hypothetical protein
MTWAQQRVQYGRLKKREYCEDDIKAILPRCQKCLTVWMKDNLPKKGLSSTLPCEKKSKVILKTYIRLRRTGKIFQWMLETEKCPFCGENHEHGGGRVGEDPLTYMGHRGAHCARNKPAEGYYLEYAGVLPPCNLYNNERPSNRRSKPKDIRQWIKNHEECVKRFKQGAKWDDCFDWGSTTNVDTT